MSTAGSSCPTGLLIDAPPAPPPQQGPPPATPTPNIMNSNPLRHLTDGQRAIIQHGWTLLVWKAQQQLVKVVRGAAVANYTNAWVLWWEQDLGLSLAVKDRLGIERPNVYGEETVFPDDCLEEFVHEMARLMEDVMVREGVCAVAARMGGLWEGKMNACVIEMVKASEELRRAAEERKERESKSVGGW